MRAVLDTNVLISALLSRRGSPARIVRAWLDGTVELIVSERLLDELTRALSYRELRSRVEPSETAELPELLRRSAQVLDDPDEPPRMRSSDRGDDFVIALAEAAQAMIVTGDTHLLGLAHLIPVLSPAEFVGELDRRR